ncbi:MAG TPA: ATP synthase A1 subunit C [Methanobacterium sp.]
MAEDLATIVTSMGFPSFEAFLVIAFIVGVVVSAVVIGIAARPLLQIYKYTYPNARVRARKGRLFTEKQFSEIIEAEDLEGVKNYLRGFPEYAKFIDQYPIEQALNAQLAESYDMLAKIAPGRNRAAFQLLLRKWDVENIKSILVAKDAGLSVEETGKLVVPYGKLTDRLDALVNAEGITDIISILEGTSYPQILEDGLPAYQETGMLLPLEAALDKYVLVNMLRTVATPSDENASLLHEYIGNIVDANNIKIIIRAKADGLKYEDIEAYMISDGYQVRDWKLKDLLESEDVAGVINGLEGTDYAPYLSEALSEYSSKGSIAVFDAALDKYVSKTAKNISLKNQNGIGPMIGFLHKKEIEIKNLKIIARGKREAGFSHSTIKEMLIV